MSQDAEKGVLGTVIAAGGAKEDYLLTRGTFLFRERNLNSVNKFLKNYL